MIFPKLSALLNEVHEAHSHLATTENVQPQSRVKTLMYILTKKHYWPYLQIKYFSSNSSLILLHNVYRQDVPIQDKELYDECRSVVLNMDADPGNNIILSLSKKIPIRMNPTAFDEIPVDTVKMYEIGYEGTMIYMYYHNQRWYISTSTCPSVDRSKYFHPKKTHGQMLNEVLSGYFPEIEIDSTIENEHQAYKDYQQKLRYKFCEQLDTTKTYSFLLVHHQNGYLMDYTTLFGENYKELFHLNTIDPSNLIENYDQQENLKTIGVKYTNKFPSKIIAMYYLQNTTPPIYAIIAHTDENMYKVSKQEIIEKEEQQIGHPNQWVNLLWIYMKNKPHITMEDYITNNPSEEWTVYDSSNTPISPARVVAKVITTMRDIIYSLYRTTTYYFKQTNSYRMNHDMDASLPPIIRFHLAQLRHLQITYHTDGPLTRKGVHHYLCHHQTMKNIRLLINAFESSSFQVQFPMDPFTMSCFTILNTHIKNQRSNITTN